MVCVCVQAKSCDWWRHHNSALSDQSADMYFLMFGNPPSKDNFWHARVVKLIGQMVVILLAFNQRKAIFDNLTPVFYIGDSRNPTPPLIIFLSLLIPIVVDFNLLVILPLEEF